LAELGKSVSFDVSDDNDAEEAPGNIENEQAVWPEQEKETQEIQGFKQAALNISPKKGEELEFVLEDLFIPMENIEEGLAITVTRQDLENNEMPLVEFSEDGNFEEESSEDEFSLDEFAPIGFAQEEIVQEDPVREEIPQEEPPQEDYPEEDFSWEDEFADLDQTQFPETNEAADREGDAAAEVFWLKENSISSPAASDSKERNIFDNLDLNAAIGAMEEKQDGATVQNPKEELENGLSPVLSTISELLSFFAARHFGQTVHAIYLTGEYSTLPNLSEIFQENLGIQTAAGFPKDWKPQFEGSSKSQSFDWQKYGSLYGLALRED
jgi:hypothetical protein